MCSWGGTWETAMCTCTNSLCAPDFNEVPLTLCATALERRSAVLKAEGTAADKLRRRLQIRYPPQKIEKREEDFRGRLTKQPKATRPSFALGHSDALSTRWSMDPSLEEGVQVRTYPPPSRTLSARHHPPKWCRFLQRLLIRRPVQTSYS